MAQVLTSEGLGEFMATGKVPEFVKPEAANEPEKEPSVVSKPAGAEPELDDKTEDDEGLTAAERKAYSEKIAKKISAKHRALKQAEATIGTEAKGRQAAEKQVADLKGEIEALKLAAKGDGSPDPKDYTDTEKYWKDVMKWTADKAVAEDRSARETERIETERQARINKFAETVDDYEEVVDSLKGVPQHQAVIEYLQEADLGANLIYYFGQHPDEYAQLTRLKPVLAVAEVGKIETRLERKVAKVEKTDAADSALERLKSTPISKAPAPIQDIPSSASPLPKDPAKMSFDELREYNRSQRLRAAQR